MRSPLPALRSVRPVAIALAALAIPAAGLVSASVATAAQVPQPCSYRATAKHGTAYMSGDARECLQLGISPSAKTTTVGQEVTFTMRVEAPAAEVEAEVDEAAYAPFHLPDGLVLSEEPTVVGSKEGEFSGEASNYPEPQGRIVKLDGEYAVQMEQALFGDPADDSVTAFTVTIKGKVTDPALIGTQLITWVGAWIPAETAFSPEEVAQVIKAQKLSCDTAFTPRDPDWTSEEKEQSEQADSGYFGGDWAPKPGATEGPLCAVLTVAAEEAPVTVTATVSSTVTTTATATTTATSTETAAAQTVTATVTAAGQAVTAAAPVDANATHAPVSTRADGVVVNAGDGNAQNGQLAATGTEHGAMLAWTGAGLALLGTLVVGVAMRRRAKH